VDGEVTEVVVTNPGKNYTSEPTITISDPDGSPADYQATASAVLTNGAVSLITINNSGKFYTSANAAIDSVTSSTATASISIDGTGQAATITVTNPGSGYRTVPTITVGNPAATSIPYQQIEFDDDWGIITVIEDV